MLEHAITFKDVLIGVGVFVVVIILGGMALSWLASHLKDMFRN